MRWKSGSGGSGGAEPTGRHRGRADRGWVRLWLWCEGAWRDFLYLVMPAECVVCGREDAALCPACASALRAQTRSPFRAEQSADALMSVFGDPLMPVVAAGNYRDALAATILAFKNHGRTELCGPLARGLARGIAALPAPGADSGTGPVWLVPVPASGAGWRRRGYHPLGLLVADVRRHHRLPPGMAVAHVLGIRARPPWRQRHQKGLGKSARRANVRNTMRICHRLGGHHRNVTALAGRAVVIVDDVLTTGATLREAAETLARAGAVVCGAVVLAAARPPEPPAAAGGVQRPGENTYPQKMNKKIQ